MSSFFSSIWGIIAIPLGFIMRYCYILFADVLKFPLAYVFALLLFTIITRAILFPLSLKQQRSTAIMGLYQPLIDEINKKYEKDPQKKQEEMAKLQQEYGFSPTAGCLPLLIQFPILFGLIEVIYKPLTYMISIPKDVINALAGLVTSSNTRLIETAIIESVQKNAGAFANVAVEGYTSEQIANYIQKISSIDMSIGSINLWDVPLDVIKATGLGLIVLIPIFSVVTMIGSQIITMKISGNPNAGGNMMTMTIVMSLMFAWFSFMYPAGFSLYWGFSNLVMIAQGFLLRKIVNVDKLREEKQREIDEKRKQKKEKKTVTVKNDRGMIEEKSYTPQELAKIRLQRAREIDAARYAAENSAGSNTDTDANE